MCQSHLPPLVFFAIPFLFLFFFFELRDFDAAHRSEGACHCVLLRHEFKVDLIRHALQPAGVEVAVCVCVCVFACVWRSRGGWVGACVGK